MTLKNFKIFILDEDRKPDVINLNNQINATIAMRECQLIKKGSYIYGILENKPEYLKLALRQLEMILGEK